MKQTITDLRTDLQPVLTTRKHWLATWWRSDVLEAKRKAIDPLSAPMMAKLKPIVIPGTNKIKNAKKKIKQVIVKLRTKK